MSQSAVSLMDTIVRIYKNSDGKVIGIHSIGVHETRLHLPTGKTSNYPTPLEKYSRGVNLTPSFQRFNLDIGGSRVVSTIQVIGCYDDFVLNGSSDDIFSVTYYGKNSQNLENDLIISLSQFPTIGATL